MSADRERCNLTFRSGEAKRSQEKRLKRYERKKKLATGHGHVWVMGNLREQLGGEVGGEDVSRS